MQNPVSFKIINAQYEHDYVLRLTFSNGMIRLCDFWPLAQKGICVKLQNLDYFKNFTLDPFTVDWNNEIGFAPEYLFEQSVPISYDADDSNMNNKVAEN